MATQTSVFGVPVSMGEPWVERKLAKKSLCILENYGLVGTHLFFTRSPPYSLRDGDVLHNDPAKNPESLHLAGFRRSISADYQNCQLSRWYAAIHVGNNKVWVIPARATKDTFNGQASVLNSSDRWLDISRYPPPQ